MNGALLAFVLVSQGEVGMASAPTATNLEGRPSPAATSPLQARIDRAEPGATIVVEPGTYKGDIYVDRPLRLVGRGRPRLVASGEGSVVRIRSNDVTVEGFDIDGAMAGGLASDTSGVHVTGRHVTLRALRIERAFFGIYLHEADDATVERVWIRGTPGMEPGEQGSGIHVYNAQRFQLRENDIADVRDGIYIQSSSGGRVERTTASRLRYGLHYMFSDDNTFEDNRFENGAAGAALMYSKRLTFRRNRFWHNRGYASVGLLLKDCESVLAEDNLIADNARGVFLEGSNHNVFRRNLIAVSDAAVILFDSSQDNAFHGNAFIANLSPLDFVGRRTDTDFDENYWSDADEPDLDGDGYRDLPYRLSSVFDHFRSNMRAADLFAQGPAARALAAAEQAFPVLRPVGVVDRRPLTRPPALDAVPVATPEHRGAPLAGLGVSVVALALGAGVFQWGRVRGDGGAR